MPPPGFHDLLAMSSYRHALIEGGIALLRAHLGFLKTMLELPRQILNGENGDER